MDDRDLRPAQIGASPVEDNYGTTTDQDEACVVDEFLLDEPTVFGDIRDNETGENNMRNYNPTAPFSSKDMPKKRMHNTRPLVSRRAKVASPRIVQHADNHTQVMSPSAMESTSKYIPLASLEDMASVEDELDALLSFAINVESEKFRDVELEEEHNAQLRQIMRHRPQPSFDDFPAMIKIQSDQIVDGAELPETVLADIPAIQTTDRDPRLGGKSQSSLRREQFMIRRLQMNQYLQKKKEGGKPKNTLFKASLPKNENLYDALLLELAKGSGDAQLAAQTQSHDEKEEAEASPDLDIEHAIMKMNMVGGGPSFHRKRDLQLRKLQGNKLKGDYSDELDSNEEATEDLHASHLADSQDEGAEGPEDELFEDGPLPFISMFNDENYAVQDTDQDVNSLMLSSKCQDVERSSNQRGILRAADRTKPVAVAPRGCARLDSDDDDNQYTGRASIAAPRMSVDVRNREAGGDHQYTGRVSIARPRMSIDVRNRPDMRDRKGKNRPVLLSHFEVSGPAPQEPSFQRPSNRMSIDVRPQAFPPGGSDDSVSSPSHKNQGKRSILPLAKINVDSRQSTKSPRAGIGKIIPLSPRERAADEAAVDQAASSVPPTASAEMRSLRSANPDPQEFDHHHHHHHHQHQQPQQFSPRMSIDARQRGQSNNSSISPRMSIDVRQQDRTSPLSPRRNPDARLINTGSDPKRSLPFFPRGATNGDSSRSDVEVDHAQPLAHHSEKSACSSVDSGKSSPCSAQKSRSMNPTSPRPSDTQSRTLSGSTPTAETYADRSSQGASSMSSRASSVGSDFETTTSPKAAALAGASEPESGQTLANSRTPLEESSPVRTSQRLGEAENPTGVRTSQKLGNDTRVPKEKLQLKNKLVSVVVGRNSSVSSSQNDRGDSQRDGFTIGSLVNRGKQDGDDGEAVRENSGAVTHFKSLTRKSQEPKKRGSKALAASLMGNDKVKE